MGVTVADITIADITIHAAYGSVVEDDGQVFIGFAAGEDEAEGYVLFRQSIGGGPLWLEVNDETFGATDGIASVQPIENGILIAIKPEHTARFGWATTVEVRIDVATEDAEATLAAIAERLGPLWRA